MMVWKMIFVFQGCILRFHVNLPRCKLYVGDFKSHVGEGQSAFSHVKSSDLTWTPVQLCQGKALKEAPKPSYKYHVYIYYIYTHIEMYTILKSTLRWQNSHVFTTMLYHSLHEKLWCFSSSPRLSGFCSTFTVSLGRGDKVRPSKRGGSGSWSLNVFFSAPKKQSGGLMWNDCRTNQSSALFENVGNLLYYTTITK